MFFLYRTDFDDDAGADASVDTAKEVMFGRALSVQGMDLRSSRFYVRPSTFNSPSHLKRLTSSAPRMATY